jgi:hypothetical protein
MTTITDTKKKIRERILQIEQDFSKKEKEQKLIKENTEILLRLNDPLKISEPSKYIDFSSIVSEYVFHQTEEYEYCINELKKIIDDGNSYYKTLSRLHNDNVSEDSAVYFDVISSAIDNFSKYENMCQEKLCFIETYDQIKHKCSQIYEKYSKNANVKQLEQKQKKEQRQEKEQKQQERQKQQKEEKKDLLSFLSNNDEKNEKNKKNKIVNNETVDVFSDAEDESYEKSSLLKEKEYKSSDYDIM